jgi:hypothetical protein
VAGRRILPLILGVLVGTVLLLVRLYQVQIVEASVWTSQAATLVRSGAVRPYQRGAIRDARGRDLAHDERIYRVMFSYRDFRREHPLGRIAHARTALLGQPEPLDRTFANLAAWTTELCQLTPAQLDSFAEGGELVLGGLTVPAGDPEREARRLRRSDARFYIVQFFGLDRSELKDFATACKQQPDKSLIELAALARGNLSPTKLSERIAARLTSACGDLRQLALQLDLDETARGAQPANDPLAHLLTRLEQWRGSVEDDTATDLFEEVYGFAPGRVEPSLVHATLDLRWIESLLGWDAPRSLLWLERARTLWRTNLFERVPERLVAELQVARPESDGPELVLERWVTAFAADPERAVARLARGGGTGGARRARPVARGRIARPGAGVVRVAGSACARGGRGGQRFVGDARAGPSWASMPCRKMSRNSRRAGRRRSRGRFQVRASTLALLARVTTTCRWHSSPSLPHASRRRSAMAASA